MRQGSPALFGVLAFSSAVFASRSAGAFEREWHLGAGVGLGSYAGTDGGASPVLGLHAAYGLSDMFDARLELVASRHPSSGDRTLDIYSAAAGIAYKIDILEWVPYAGVLGGVYLFDGEPKPEDGKNVALSAILGLDYEWSRSLGLGAELRYNGLLLDAPKSFTDAAYFTGILHAEYRFGW
jgi:hypothetical protein